MSCIKGYPERIWALFLVGKGVWLGVVLGSMNIVHKMELWTPRPHKHKDPTSGFSGPKQGRFQKPSTSLTMGPWHGPRISCTSTLYHIRTREPYVKPTKRRTIAQSGGGINMFTWPFGLLGTTASLLVRHPVECTRHDMSHGPNSSSDFR